MVWLGVWCFSSLFQWWWPFSVSRVVLVGCFYVYFGSRSLVDFGIDGLGCWVVERDGEERKTGC